MDFILLIASIHKLTSGHQCVDTMRFLLFIVFNRNDDKGNRSI